MVKRQGLRERFSSKKKVEAVLGLLRGEELDAVSRELGVTAARLSKWRETLLSAGAASLKSRPRDGREEEIARLKEVIGELTMRNELLREANRRLAGGLRLGLRRSMA
jgi:hypothetical protein